MLAECAIDERTLIPCSAQIFRLKNILKHLQVDEKEESVIFHSTLDLARTFQITSSSVAILLEETLHSWLFTFICILGYVPKTMSHHMDKVANVCA
jgi:hypothetical protein